MSKGPLASRGYNAHYRYYNAQDKQKEEEVNKHHKNFQTLKENLEKLLEKVDKTVKPTGTLNKPARTCRELFESYPTILKSGSYFIDPNEGASNDAVLATCNRETFETCISPADSFKVDKKNWGNFDDQYKWIMSDLHNGAEIGYKMEVPQMKVLQSLSMNVRQTFTYHCKNSFALTDDTGAQSAHPLMFKVDNEDVETLAVKVESRKLMYDIVHDDCAKKHWTWRNTTIEVKSQLPEQLPILDVAAHDIGGYDEEFGLDVGPVCFS